MSLVMPSPHILYAFDYDISGADMSMIQNPWLMIIS